MKSLKLFQKKNQLGLSSKQVQIKELVLFPSSKCNLNCKHCSYLCNSNEKDNVSIRRLKKIIDEAVSYGVRLFILVAKEPLMEIDRTKEILEYLTEKNAKFGIVTNGTLIKSNIDILKKFKFDYFDVSIDGTEEYHDLTRGVGAFAKAEEGVKTVLSNNLTEKFFISCVSMSYNYKDIPQMIDYFSNLGVKNFSIGVYVYTGKNPKEWILKKEQLKELILKLSNIKNVNQLLIDIHKQVNEYWDYLVHEEVIKKDGITRDKNNVVYYHIPGTTLFIKNSLFTTNSDYTGIITADGYYLDDYQYLSYPSYRDYAIGNIKSESLRDILKRIKTE